MSAFGIRTICYKTKPIPYNPVVATIEYTREDLEDDVPGFAGGTLDEETYSKVSPLNYSLHDNGDGLDCENTYCQFCLKETKASHGRRDGWIIMGFGAMVDDVCRDCSMKLYGFDALANKHARPKEHARRKHTRHLADGRVIEVSGSTVARRAGK